MITHVRVKTFNRPRQLAALLEDIGRHARGPLDLTVFDDASRQSMDVPHAICDGWGWLWVRAEQNHGKQRAWAWQNEIFESLRALPESELALLCDDDVRLCENFFERALEAWHSIPGTDKVSLLMHVDDSRVDNRCWTGVLPTNVSPLVRRTQWLDGSALLINRKLLEAVDWHLEAISPRWWKDDPRRSTGVGRQLSARLHAAGLGMYQTQESLVLHTPGPSLYNPEERRRVPLRTVRFADGPQAFQRLARGARVHASIATQRSRLATLEQVVAALRPQVDVLRVYLNDVQRVPGFLDQPKVVHALGHLKGDRGDAGKFFWSAEISGYHFACDDDIAYPPDYVERMCASIEHWGRRVVVGVHGVKIHEEVDSYYRDRDVVHFSHALAQDTPQHILGTGCVAYHTDTIAVTPALFEQRNMADVWLGIAAQAQRVPMVAVRRNQNWLRALPTEGSIYDDKKNADADVTAALKRHWPWTLLVPKRASVRKLVKGMRKR